MKSKRSESATSSEKFRYGAELGAILREFMRNPPYLEPTRKLGFHWEAKTFASAIKDVSDNAVRQWLRGDALPDQYMPRIILVLFGPEPRQFADEVKKLKEVYQRCVDIRDGRKGLQPLSPTESIPRLTPYFIGRDNDVERLADIIATTDDGCSILIQGAPGMGKTELTKAVAHQKNIVARFGQRRWFIPLDAAMSVQGVLNALSSALGTDPDLGVKAIITRLSLAPALLILDNIETPLEQADPREDVEKLLAEISVTPGLALLASQRGSQIIQGLAWTLVHRLNVLERSDAAKLFLKIAHFKNPTDPFFSKFMGALGGLPLAIVLVALRAHGNSSLAKLWSEWVRIGTKLAGRPGFDPTRHTSLTVSIELSLNSPRLNEEAKRLFAILGRTPDGLSERERNMISGDGSFILEETLCWVGLAFDRDDRLRLLPPIREYARRLPLPPEDDLNWTKCLLNAVRELQDKPSSSFNQNLINFCYVSKGLNNIDAAITTLIESNNDEIVKLCLDGLILVSQRYNLPVNIATKLQEYFTIEKNPIARGKVALLVAHVAERVSHLELAVASYKIALFLFQKENHEQLLALTHLKYGEYQNRKERHRGRHNLMLARTISSRNMDKFGEVNANVGLAIASLMDSSYDTARRVLEESLDYYTENDLFVYHAECSEALAKIYEIQFMYDCAIEHYNFAESIWRNHGFQRNLAKCLISKSSLYFALLDNNMASQLTSESLDIFYEIGDEKGIGDCLYRRAKLSYHQDSNIESAFIDLKRAEDIYTKINDENGLGHCTYFRSLVTGVTENPEDLKNVLLSAREHFHNAGNVCEQAQCTYDLAALSIYQEEYNSALELIIEAQTNFYQRGDYIGVLNCKILTAEFYCNAEEYKEAENIITDVLEFSRQIGSRLHEAQSLEILGNIFSIYQRHNEARAAYKQAATIYQQLNMTNKEAICLNYLNAYDNE